LKNLNSSEKVKIVNVLRGKNKEKGLVETEGGTWLANRVFIIPIQKEYIFEKLFINFKIKFKKYFVLMH